MLKLLDLKLIFVLAAITYVIYNYGFNFVSYTVFITLPNYLIGVFSDTLQESFNTIQYCLKNHLVLSLSGFIGGVYLFNNRGV